MLCIRLGILMVKLGIFDLNRFFISYLPRSFLFIFDQLHNLITDQTDADIHSLFSTLWLPILYRHYIL